MPRSLMVAGELRSDVFWNPARPSLVGQGNSDCVVCPGKQGGVASSYWRRFLPVFIVCKWESGPVAGVWLRLSRSLGW